MCITYRAALVQNWSDGKNNCQHEATYNNITGVSARLREHWNDFTPLGIRSKSLSTSTKEWGVGLKYGSEEKDSSLCKCYILLGFFMSKKQERLRSELLQEDKITNLLGFLTK